MSRIVPFNITYKNLEIIRSFCSKHIFELLNFHLIPKKFGILCMDNTLLLFIIITLKMRLNKVTQMKRGETVDLKVIAIFLGNAFWFRARLLDQLLICYSVWVITKSLLISHFIGIWRSVLEFTFKVKILLTIHMTSKDGNSSLQGGLLVLDFIAIMMVS